ncbi:uncharacterized protein BO95DRAFT_466156 [Aspergillus brunneoviolaceus CBS 621.78]|uniref:Uncharacterized protein n=1 Tax=Aspergillus brunneoviolaceus CBS 621.78 TaxID=1450534 RepID=A0ACD1G1N4_9EURO|nr:hypothetical protein BO95DRAFT_466156 [Aspergillus brunneoviolaceus CBS 621.78]RAH43169.1 hypothetical protein BO95DRAFT_466156 [Aspergillus brunneoviolaceus CBS 621.78]
MSPPLYHLNLAYYVHYLPEQLRALQVPVQRPRMTHLKCGLCHRLQEDPERALHQCSNCYSCFHLGCVAQLRIHELSERNVRLVYGCPSCGTPWLTPQHSAEERGKSASPGKEKKKVNCQVKYQYQRNAENDYVCTVRMPDGRPCGVTAALWDAFAAHHARQHESRR